MKINPLTASQLLECKSIIKKYLLFSPLSDADLDQLAKLFLAYKYEPRALVVEEGDLIDAVYFIVTGKVEVKKKLSDQKESVPIAILGPTEAIGLNDTGYYSTTSKRSASVIALTDLLLFRINIQELSHFLNAHSQFQQSLKEYSQLLLRMNFIKQIAPFSELPIDAIASYANQISEIKVEKNITIFQQGDMGDKCYLICNGRVEILIEGKDSQHEKVAILESPAIFGETALMMQAPRNATVKTMTECDLLVVDQVLFMEILKEENVKQSLKNIISRRSRPNKKPDIESYVAKCLDGSEVFILKDPQRGKYCRLTQEGWFIWQQLDGKKSLRDITSLYFKEFNMFKPVFVSKLILELERTGFIHVHEQPKLKNQQPGSWQISIKKWFEFKIIFNDIDPWITKIYEKGLYLFFNKYLQILFILMSLIGFVVFCSQFNYILSVMKSMGSIKWWLFVSAIPAGIGIIVLHELAHALTTKYYGRKVKSLGFGWVWIGPIAFCDTSDMWLSTRWPRVWVDLSGLYIQLIIAAISVLIIPLIVSHNWQLLLWFFALYNYLLICWNLTPILNFDGYYALMDWLDEPNLREKSIAWLFQKKNTSKVSSWKNAKNEIIYWSCCIGFLVFELIFSYIIFKYLLDGLFGIMNPFYSFTLALLSMTLSILGIGFEIKKVQIPPKN